MARIRTIKPDFFKNEQISELSAMHRLLFIGLWTQADREGKLEDRPKRLKVEIFPYDDFDLNSALHDLQVAGLIIRYADFVDQAEINIIKILTFQKHQQPNIKEAKSILPEPVNIQAPSKHGADTVLASQEGKGKEGKGTGKERKEEVLAPDEVFFNLPWDDEVFTEAWAAWKNYKKKEHDFKYKDSGTEAAALDELVFLSQKNLDVALAIIKQSIAKGWKGLFELKENKKTTNNSTQNGVKPKSRIQQLAELGESKLSKNRQ